MAITGLGTAHRENYLSKSFCSVTSSNFELFIKRLRKRSQAQFFKIDFFLGYFTLFFLTVIAVPGASYIKWSLPVPPFLMC